MLYYTWSFLLLLILMAGYLLKHAKETGTAGPPERGPSRMSVGASPWTEWTPPQQIGVRAGFWGHVWLPTVKGRIS